MKTRTILTIAVMFSVASGASRIASAQQRDGAAVYKAACAECHDQPQVRTPSREALKDRTPEAVLQALTGGSMALQAQPLSTAEKRAVAEFVAGKPMGPGSEMAGMCSAGERTTDPARRPQPLRTSQGGTAGASTRRTAGFSRSRG